MNNFDNIEYEAGRKQYESEARDRWGETDAYGEHTKKTSGYTQDQWNDAIDGMNSIEITIGYKYFIFLLDMIDIIVAKIIVDNHIINTIPIASVGPVNNGYI